MSKKVVFLLPRLTGGGAERVSLTFLKGLLGRGYEIHLIAFSCDGLDAIGLPLEVKIHELGHSRLRSALSGLVSLLRRLKPNLVYSTHGYVNVPLILIRSIFVRQARLLLREANTPSIAIRGQRFGAQIDWLYKRLYRKADAIICQSSRMQCELAENYYVPRRNLHLIYNPTDHMALRNCCRPERFPGDGVRFVAAGSLHYKKGFDRLIEWLARASFSGHLTIMGEGPQRSQLEARIRDLGLEAKVYLPGYVENPWNFIAGADAFLLPSRWEGMPNVVLEALACGVPAIAMAEAGGISDIKKMVAQEALVLCSDGTEFVSAMGAVVPRREKLAIGESLLPEAFEMNHGVGRFAQLVESVLEN